MSPVWLLFFSAMAGGLPAQPHGLPAWPPVGGVEVSGPATVARARVAADPGPSRYSIGEPTDEEQLGLELINRARANPVGEGATLRVTADPEVAAAYRFFGVDLDLMAVQMAALIPAPPLAFNARLLAAARLHSGDMLTNVFQDHVGSDGRGLGSRAAAQGYVGQLGENVYASAKSVFYGHAGFEVDWGGPTGGMQDPAGHRLNRHNPVYREVGLGVVMGANAKTVGGVTSRVGPYVVTEDFGVAAGSTPFLTGVVYYDLNTNGVYDVGEGIGGVTVLVSNVNFFAVTAGSGGYAVPLPGDGSYVVEFSAAGMEPVKRVAQVVGGANVKLDFTPGYVAPRVAGTGRAFVNRTNELGLTVVGAANGYRVEERLLAPFDVVEGAENGTNGVVVEASAGYAVISTAVRASGAASFHLAMPEGESQFITLRPVLRVGAASRLNFASRLRLATEDQVARAQVSADEGVTWEDVWSQAGTDASGDPAFVARSVSLGAYAGRFVRVRFAYTFTTGSFYPQTTASVGFYVDDIAVTGAVEALPAVVTEVERDRAFGFKPANAGTYSVRVQARVGNRWLPFGPATEFAGVSAPSVGAMVMRLVESERMQFDVGLAGGEAGALVIESATEVAGPYRVAAGAIAETVVAGSSYRVTVDRAGGRAFFRVRVLP